MVLADWIAIGVAIAVLALGALAGFGRALKWFTGGIMGILISVFVCYLIGGFFLDIEGIRNMLASLAANWKHIDWLYNMRLEIIIYYIVLFLLCQIARILIVKIIGCVVETDLLPLKIINKVGGALFFFGVGLLITLLIFQIIYWVGGSALYDFYGKLAGSAFGLDKLLMNNPLVKFVDYIKGIVY